jgi:hypothetical protein
LQTNSIANKIITNESLKIYIKNNYGIIATQTIQVKPGLTCIPKTIFFNDNGIKYTGVDIVESLITSHLKNFPAEKRFLCKDITIYDDFDKVDIIIIRDVIFHLKNDDILSIFANIKHKFKFLIITTCKNKSMAF